MYYNFIYAHNMILNISLSVMFDIVNGRRYIFCICLLY